MNTGDVFVGFGLWSNFARIDFACLSVNGDEIDLGHGFSSRLKIRIVQSRIPHNTQPCELNLSMASKTFLRSVVTSMYSNFFISLSLVLVGSLPLT